jgi:aminoglycoside phosphotransferase (APT) family kinase protein
MSRTNDSGEAERELTPAIAAELIGAERSRPAVTGLAQTDHWRGETYIARAADGTGYLIKLFPGTDPGQVLKEANVYRRIAAVTEVPVPAVIAVDEDAARGPCPSFVTEYVDGRHIDGVSVLAPGAQDRLFEELGAHYGRIHRSVTFDRFGLVGASAAAPFEEMATETWKEWIERRVERQIEGLAGSRFADCRPRASAFFDDRRSTLDGTFEPVLLHDDYGLDNVLVAPGGDPLIRALLDFERAIAGPAEHGFVKAERAFTRGVDRPDSLREAFRAGYAESAPLPDAGLDGRGDVYRLEALLNEMLFTNVAAERGHVEGAELEDRIERLRAWFDALVQD